MARPLAILLLLSCAIGTAMGIASQACCEPSPENPETCYLVYGDKRAVLNPQGGCPPVLQCPAC